jgi:hypothetical protein
MERVALTSDTADKQDIREEKKPLLDLRALLRSRF